MQTPFYFEEILLEDSSARLVNFDKLSLLAQLTLRIEK